MSQVQPIEGITPGSLWTTAGVLLALAGIAIVIFKIVEFCWNVKDRKQKTNQLQGKDLTDEIADKVIAKLEPRLAGMEKKLSSDKDRLDNHEAQIREMYKANEVIRDGLEVTCNALTAVLDHELHNGNNEQQMEQARDGLQRYTSGLLKRVI